MYLTHFRFVITSLTCAFCITAHAGLFDSAKTTTESKQTFLVYDLAGYQGPLSLLQAKVKEGLTYRGDNAFIKDSLLSGEPPKFPAKMEFKTLNFGPMSVVIPTCNGSAFSISSSDNGQASYGDAARYMACAFPYVGGYRVNFYASYTSRNGGAEGLFSGKTLGKLIAGAVGINSDPQKFIETSISKMEELFVSSDMKFQIIEMNPRIEGKVVVEDPLVKQQAADSKKSTDRSKRLAARAELGKLGIDASDRSRLVKAIQSSDEDVVALFVEASAMDFAATDDLGKRLADYATNPSIKALLPIPPAQ